MSPETAAAATRKLDLIYDRFVEGYLVSLRARGVKVAADAYDVHFHRLHDNVTKAVATNSEHDVTRALDEIGELLREIEIMQQGV